MENRRISVPEGMDFMGTLKNAGGKPVKLEQGKGGVILLCSCDGHSARNSMRRETLFLHSGIGRKRGDGIPLPGRGCFYCRMKKPVHGDVNRRGKTS